MAMIPGTVAEIRDTTVGGLPAKVVEISISEDAPCPPTDFYLWFDEREPSAPRRPAAQASAIKVWIVDVDGGRLVVDSDMFTFSPADLLAGATVETSRAFDSLVSSMRIAPISEADLRYADQVLKVCTATSERFASAGVVGSFHGSAPTFATLADAETHAIAAAGISERALRDLRELDVPPGLDEAGTDKEYALIEDSVEALRGVPAAVRAGDSDLITVLLAEAYRLTYATDPDASDPFANDPSLVLLSSGLAGCRLPQGPG
jgi:hypothetical protein